MGRYDLRALRVHDAAALLMKTNRRNARPPWFDTMTDVPPSQTLVRTLPVQHRDQTRRQRIKKPSKMFKPQQIVYEEDNLRMDFFSDHPWELARPRIVVENDGKDLHRWDWSKSYQMGRPVDGESVIQRQRWLMSNATGTDDAGQPTILSKAAAYDKARKELYERRHYDAIEQRVAREEAMATGAYFGLSSIEVGAKLESETFDKWRTWAVEQVTLQEQSRSAAYTGSAAQSESSSEPGDALDAALDSYAEEPAQ